MSHHKSTSVLGIILGLLLLIAFLVGGGSLVPLLPGLALEGLVLNGGDLRDLGELDVRVLRLDALAVGVHEKEVRIGGTLGRVGVLNLLRLLLLGLVRCD